MLLFSYETLLQAGPEAFLVRRTADENYKALRANGKRPDRPDIPTVMDSFHEEGPGGQPEDAFHPEKRIFR